MLSIKEYYKQPHLLGIAILTRCNMLLPERLYLKLLYYFFMDRRLRLNNPKTFNEKLQWLKLHDRRPEYTRMVDKVAVKDYVADILGKDVIIPTLGVWKQFDDIDFDLLPNQFVLKTNHSGGCAGVVVCKDKTVFDKLSAKKKLTTSLKKQIYPYYREWPYKDISPCIFAEEYMEDQSGELRDYKLMCFNGKVKCSFVVTGRGAKNGPMFDFFDKEWRKMSFIRVYPNSGLNIAKPQSYEQMIEMAEKLARGIRFVRIDFYEIGGKPYFGEITFYPGSGMERFTPEEWDYELGNWIKL